MFIIKALMSLFFTFSQYRITKLTLIIVIFLRMNIISIKAIESETFDLLFFVGLFCLYAHVRVCVWGEPVNPVALGPEGGSRGGVVNHLREVLCPL